MTQDIVYTIGIIFAILLLILFLRSVLLRRQRLVDAHAENPQFPSPIWQFRGDYGMDVVRPEPAVTNFSSRPGIPRTRTQDSDSRDQLPRYEAPPPGYDVIIKDLERGELAQGEEQGGPSRARPPGYNTPYRGGDETAVAVNEAPTETPGPANHGGDGTSGQGGFFGVDMRRAWSGFGR